MLTECQMSNKRLRKALKRKNVRKPMGFISNASYLGKCREDWYNMSVEHFQPNLPRAQKSMNLYAKVAAFFRRKTI